MTDALQTAPAPSQHSAATAPVTAPETAPEMTPATAPLQPGDTFHWLKSGVTFLVSEAWGAGEISRRGMSVCLTDAMIRANKDRNGASWLDLVDAPEAQIRRWGEVAFARGPFPADLPTWVESSPEQEEARDVALRDVRLLPEREQPAALAELRRVFGRFPTSRTLWEQPEAQERREWEAPPSRTRLGGPAGLAAEWHGGRPMTNDADVSAHMLPPETREYLTLSRELGGTPEARQQAREAVFGTAAASAPVVTDAERLRRYLTGPLGMTAHQAEQRARVALDSLDLDSSRSLVALARAYAADSHDWTDE
jgi:hypothetical protein